MLNRRDFLISSAALGAAGALGRFAPEAEARLPGGSIIDRPASAAPIDTGGGVVMETRSFDHYLGWLAADEDYLETGRSLWGRRFAVDGSTDETYPSPAGGDVSTFPMLVAGREKDRAR